MIFLSEALAIIIKKISSKLYFSLRRWIKQCSPEHILIGSAIVIGIVSLVAAVQDSMQKLAVKREIARKAEIAEMQRFQKLNKKHIAKYGWEIKERGCYNCDRGNDYCNFDVNSNYCDRCERLTYLINASPNEKARYWTQEGMARVKQK